MADQFVQELIVRVKLDGEEKLARVTEGVKKAGKATADAAKDTQKLAPEIRNVQHLLERMEKTYERTGTTSTRSIASLSFALRELEKQHGGNIAAAERLSQAERDMAMAASAAVKEATVRTKRYNDELQRVRSLTRDWTGFNRTLQGLGPTIQKVTQATFAMWGAWSAGWNVGKKIDKFMTERVPAWGAMMRRVADNFLKDFQGTGLGKLLGIADTRGLDARDAASDARIAMLRARRGLTEPGVGVGGLVKDAEDATKALKGTVAAVKELAVAIKMIPGHAVTRGFGGPAGGGFGALMASHPGIAAENAFEQWKGSAEEMAAVLADMQEARQADEKRHYAELARFWHEKQEDAAERFGDRMSGVLSGLALGDLDLGSMFVQSVEKASGELSELFGGILLSAFGGDRALPGETPEETAQRTAKTQQNLTAALEGVVAIAGGFQANQRGQTNDTQTIATMTMTGLAIGGTTIVGALLGAVVGLVAGIVSAISSSAGDNYPYGRMGIRDGEAFFNPTQNIGGPEQKEALQRLQATFDEFYSGYLKILLKFPTEILPDFLDSMDIDPTIGKERGGDFGREASRMFWQDYEQYLTGGLPREVADRFKGMIKDGLVGLGMGEQRFEDIWADLDRMDPKKAMQNLAMLVDAVLAFNEAIGFFSTPMNTTVGAGFHIEEGLMQRVYQEGNRSFGSQLRIDDEALIRLGEALSSLPLEAQIQSAHELAGLMTERMNKEKAFLQSIIAGIENIRKSFEGSIRDLTLRGMVGEDGTPNYQGQVDYLKEYLDQLQQRMSLATSPEAVNDIAAEIQRVIMQIVGLGESAGGVNAANYREWGIDILTQVQEDAIARMNELAAEVEAANDAFLSAIQGFIDAFLGATNQLSPEDGKGEDVGLPRDPTLGPRVPGPDDPDLPNYLMGEMVGKQVESNSILREIADKEWSITVNVPLPPSSSSFSSSIVTNRGVGL